MVKTDGGYPRVSQGYGQGLIQSLARGGQSNTAAADQCRHCLYGVPMTSRLLKFIGLFCRVSSLL